MLTALLVVLALTFGFTALTVLSACILAGQVDRDLERYEDSIR